MLNFIIDWLTAAMSLAFRKWDYDCLTYTPDYLSILIEINEALRRYDEDNHSSLKNTMINKRILFSVSNVMP